MSRPVAPANSAASVFFFFFPAPASVSSASPDGAPPRQTSFRPDQTSPSRPMFGPAIPVRARSASTPNCRRHSAARAAHEATTESTVWGTDVYTDDSGLCRSALHAGVISSKGGLITVTRGAGKPLYSRHDAQWRARRATIRRRSRSMEFKGTAPPPPGPGLCPRDLASCREFPRRSHAGAAPRRRRAAPSWGTDVYTDDSAMCRAAFHAGRIPLSGGVVTVMRGQGRALYVGTTRNGVVSFDYPRPPPASRSASSVARRSRIVHEAGGATMRRCLIAAVFVATPLAVALGAAQARSDEAGRFACRRRAGLARPLGESLPGLLSLRLRRLDRRPPAAGGPAQLRPHERNSRPQRSRPAAHPRTSGRDGQPAQGERLLRGLHEHDRDRRERPGAASS